MQCHDGDTIRVMNANYGRRSAATCPQQYNAGIDSLECVNGQTLSFVNAK